MLNVTLSLSHGYNISTPSRKEDSRRHLLFVCLLFVSTIPLREEKCWVTVRRWYSSLQLLTNGHRFFFLSSLSLSFSFHCLAQLLDKT